MLREAASARLNDALKESGRSGSGGRSRSRLRTTLAVFEVTMALILLVGAGAMVRTFSANSDLNPGSIRKSADHADRAAAAEIFWQRRSNSFYEPAGGSLDEHSTRGTAVAADGAADGFYIAGPAGAAGRRMVPELRAVSGRYFETLRLPIVRRARDLGADDRDHSLAVVLSKSVAQNIGPAKIRSGAMFGCRKTIRGG